MSNKKLLEGLDELRKALQEAHAEYEAKNDAWWKGLTEEEREDAFYAVVKRIYQGDVIEKGTYRYVLYHVFGFDPGMYGRGMDCGYLNLHNIIFDGLDFQKMRVVTRFEVIDEEGRSYTKYLKENERVDFSLQDDDRTLKLFVGDHNYRSEP
jgi:hypothetical protein